MWKKISEKTQALSLLVRVKLKNGYVSDWRALFTFPTDGYAEIGGPFLIRDILYLEINPIEVKHIGKLVPNEYINHSVELRNFLIESKIYFKEVNSSFFIPSQGDGGVN